MNQFKNFTLYPLFFESLVVKDFSKTKNQILNEKSSRILKYDVNIPLSKPHKAVTRNICTHEKKNE
jgi:hypothetical protein